tara:strand:+ start:1510 stop:4008 length:2499 start_codon:yes stop_codon:yes gene_type:complete
MNNLLCFTFPKITTKVNKAGIEKKVPHGLPSWADITRENMADYTDPSHMCKGIICGEKSGITVLDFDTKSAYFELIQEYPDLQQCYTVSTNKGYHIYFKYDAMIPSTTNPITCIDVRNNGTIVFAPPTTYTLKNASVVKYENIIDGVLMDFPEYLKERFITKPKQTKKKIKEPTIIPVSEPVTEPLIIPNDQDVLFIDKVIEHGLITHLATSYLDWIKIGFIIKATVGIALGFELFNKFSKLSNVYDENAVRVFWNTKQTYTGRVVTLSSLKKIAKDYNPIVYKQIYNECYPKEPKEPKEPREPKVSKRDLENREQVDNQNKLDQLWQEKLERGDMETLPDKREIPFFLGMYNGVMSDLEATQKLLKIYPYFVFCKGILYAFSYTTGLWTCNKSEVCAMITKFERYLHIMNYIDGTWVKSEFKSYGNCLNLIEIIYNLMKSQCSDNTWLKRVQNSGLHKLLFPNGWYDFNTKLFYDKSIYPFNPDNVFFGCMPYPFEPFTDSDILYMETIKQRLFYDTIGVNLGNYFILNIARGLSGECMKRIIFAIGDTNSGKGVLTAALSCALGEYAGTFNAESLAYRETSSDEAQQNRWILLLASRRIIISNEVKSNVKFNGNTIKKLVSGGDSIVGRTHGGEETECITHFMPIVFTNDMMPIVPYDSAVHDRVGCISFNKHFVKDNPSDDTELLMDPNIKAEVATKRFSQCLVGLLLQTHAAYVDNNRIEPICEEAVNSKDTWIAPSKLNPIELFLQEFEFTNKESDLLDSKCIDEWHASQPNLGISALKIRLLIKEYAKKNNLVNIVTKPHKINKKTVQCWHGISKICMIEDEGCDG